MADTQKDQQHPQEVSDRQIVNLLLNAEPTEYHLAELARLQIRYLRFPGAQSIQTDLERVLHRWQLTEATLFEKTRHIHNEGQVYKGRGSKRSDDWA
jgi:hypothetical protein